MSPGSWLVGKVCRDGLWAQEEDLEEDLEEDPEEDPEGDPEGDPDYRRISHDRSKDQTLTSETSGT